MAESDDYLLNKVYLSKAFRQSLIRRENEDELTYTSAAIEIQRIARGYLSRCHILSIAQQKLSHKAVYGESKTFTARLDDVQDTDAENEFTDFECHYMKYLRETVQMQVNPEMVMDFLRQNLEDMRMLRFAEICNDKRKKKPYSKLLRKKYNIAEGVDWQPKVYKEFCVSAIQGWARHVLNERHINKRQTKRSERPRRVLTRDTAATVIQNAWRRHIDTQVYKYYRDLINFQQKGDPSLMLRCVNPKEAQFMDAAAGIHVKFRLAGERFPPNIYYKIFTHRPVQDLCANAPRDYTKASCKKLMSRDLHNKSQRAPVIMDDKSGWYQRIENNGWRLVSDRLIHHIMNDPVTWDTSNKKIDYHHVRLKRKQDVMRKKKERKIEWMKKMYQEGMLKARVKDKETVHLIEGATLGMMATIEAQGENAVQDWEVDELLDWTTGLNFEDYWKSWKTLGTTEKSEQVIEDRLTLKVSGLDPFEINVTQEKPLKVPARKSMDTPRSSVTPTNIEYPRA